ncbi:MAG: xanthine dehydrogenase family protein molybdopterin-binding subunit, partial [Hyphomicrobiales bacterium]|nr:xanthine dehydrogenase family protein molybdopterin-binding subunit [Hyphomicrobiales bacterium]
RLEIWTGTQAPGIAQTACATLLGIDSENVVVNTTHLGGGFGRRAEVDFVLYATALSAKTNGRPIKVTWTREEDMRHDTYRPAARGRIRARITPQDGLTAFDMKITAPSVMKSMLGRTFPGFSPAGPDKSVVDGTFNQPLAIANSRYQGVVADIGIPVGFWRSVGNSFNGFFHECFLDEAAEKAGQDPLDFRLAMMTEDVHRPAREVLKRVADMAGWGGPLGAGRGRGIAHVLSFGTWVAQIVEVEIVDDAVRIDKIWCAADPGLVLDPANFEAQMVSGIVFGLSQAIGQEITFAHGQVAEENFPDFPLLTFAQCPEIEVAILENSPRMGGAGEPGTPPAAPALANAIHSVTGKRIRRLPLSREIAFV